MDKLEARTTGDAVTMADHPTPKTTKQPVAGLSDPRRCSARTTGPIRSTRSSGTCARPPSRAKGARSSSSRTDCEIPASWSQLATNVVANKYFYGEVGTDERETGVRQLIHRVCRTIADWGIDDGYFASAEPTASGSTAS